MATTLATFDTGHADMVHDIQFDYYGKRVASCSSDRTVKIFDVSAGNLTHLADLLGHEGPVWQIAWGHPKFGTLLASCSYDHRVIVWKETQENLWSQVYVSDAHTASVNAVAWAPYELGAVLACASSDGSVSILTSHPDGTWQTEKIENAHLLGCTSVSWAPAAPRGSLVSGKAPGAAVRRFATGGCDNTVKVWQYNEHAKAWQQEGPPLQAHTDWVRDVAWAPNLGLPASTVASAGQDGAVYVWSERGGGGGGAEGGGGWDRVLLADFKAPVWSVSWSTTGNLLSVSDANNAVSLWKEGLDGAWAQVPS